ncbi:hypothetical protein RQP46_009581 [Phenoliferia psychrophenolica]
MAPRARPKAAAAGDSPKKLSKEATWAIKKPDAEPLLRRDIQWQVLTDIFSDRTFRFTAPVDSGSPVGPAIFLNFDQLYLEALLSSIKTTQNLRSKLIEHPPFAVNFCKICLLINVGRINTTLAFYPSMKTALRTYHPVPSLQADDPSRKDMQDAPRIKGILKACFLDWEVMDQPTVLKDIAKKAVAPALTRGPPTTVVTAIFLLFAEAAWVSEKYFPPGFDLYDLFYPSDMPSLPRAHAFLSLVHHVLESKSFLADFDTPTPPPIPLERPIVIDRLDAHPQENVDPVEELTYAREMKEVRLGIVKTVPAYLKREEQLNQREQKKVEKEKEKDEGPGIEPANKKRRVAGADNVLRSYAKVAHDNDAKEAVPDILPYGWEYEDWSHTVPNSSGLPHAWHKTKRDMEQNHDPDYDSDEEDAWSYDTLLRRQLLTVEDPTTGQRVPVKQLKEYDEWIRRRDHGTDGGDDAESVVQDHGDEMDMDRGSDGDGDD